MSGKDGIRFSELFADTLRAHGVVWAESYYVRKHGMTRTEFAFWLAAVGVR